MIAKGTLTLRHILLGAVFLLDPWPSVAAAIPALPETCYLFSYFYHDRQAEGMRLAWSGDGRKFEMIHGGAVYLRPTVGEAKLMRDPCLYRGPDGTFHLVWTTAWAGKTIGYASSRDLIHWSPQQAISVMAHEPQTVNCWAPEIIWDEQKRHYLIFWSSTILGLYPETSNSNKRPESNNRIYATTTRDFVTFTPTRLFYNGGFNVIDAALAPADSGWLMFVKNETLTPKTEKNIRLIRGPTLDGPWGEASPPLTGDYWAEGPSALRHGHEWWVYFDKHRLDAIGLVVSRDLRTWTDLSDQVSFPPHARHGTVIAVPRAIVTALLDSPPPLSAGVLAAAVVNGTAPYPECHASTIVELAPGQLVAAWFGGTKERNPDVGIWVARGHAGRWERAVEVANGLQPDGRRFPTWNPVLFHPPGGPLVLFYKIGPSPSQWWGMMTTSPDGGATWTAPQRLPDGILGPIKNKPVLLPNGAWLCPASTEGAGGWQVHFEITRDGGRSWSKSAPVADPQQLGAIQPAVLVHRDGRLQALMRTRTGAIAETWSTDRGLSWSPLAKTKLPNPNSGIDAVTLADGRHLVVYNHSAPPRERPNKGVRYPLDVAVSTDGKAWTPMLALETEPLGNGYAYPAVMQGADGRVHVTYTWNRQRIKHVVLDPHAL